MWRYFIATCFFCQFTLHCCYYCVCSTWWVVSGHQKLDIFFCPSVELCKPCHIVRFGIWHTLCNLKIRAAILMSIFIMHSQVCTRGIYGSWSKIISLLIPSRSLVSHHHSIFFLLSFTTAQIPLPVLLSLFILFSAHCYKLWTNQRLSKRICIGKYILPLPNAFYSLESQVVEEYWPN